MSNLEYVAELCGTNSVDWICEQLAGDLDQRDNEITKLKELMLEAIESLSAARVLIADDFTFSATEIITKVENTLYEATE